MSTEYRMKLFAILEGINMDKVDQLILFGGINNELTNEKAIEIGKLKTKINRMENIIKSWEELQLAIKLFKSSDGD